MYPLSIDFDVPYATYTPTFEALEDRVATAIASLVDLNALPQPNEITEEERELSQNIFAGNQLASDVDLSRPGVVAHLGAMLNEYDKVVVQSAGQLRTYVTNKLLLETEHPDARIRMKSLELLGKISDVGLFTDKTEITMRHKPTEELEQLLRERLTRVIESEAADIPAKRVRPDLAPGERLDISGITDV
jgi:hypothetical protein